MNVGRKTHIYHPTQFQEDQDLIKTKYTGPVRRTKKAHGGMSESPSEREELTNILGTLVPNGDGNRRDQVGKMEEESIRDGAI